MLLLAHCPRNTDALNCPFANTRHMPYMPFAQAGGPAAAGAAPPARPTEQQAKPKEKPKEKKEEENKVEVELEVAATQPISGVAVAVDTAAKEPSEKEVQGEVEKYGKKEYGPLRARFCKKHPYHPLC